jgi:hypothetical protein
MATPEYPSTLPGPGSFVLESTAQVLGSENEIGAEALRRRSRQPMAKADIAFRYIETDYTQFIEWFRAELYFGLRWFWLQLPSAGGITWHLIRFDDRYTSTLEGHRYWNVSAKIEIRERRFEPFTLP